MGVEPEVGATHRNRADPKIYCASRVPSLDKSRGPYLSISPWQHGDE